MSPLPRGTDQRSLPELLRMQADRHGDRTFLQFGAGDPISFGEMESRTNSLARGLRSLGLERSDRLAMILPNSAELIELWFAASKLGGIEVPVNGELTAGLLEHVIRNSGARIVACHERYLQHVSPVISTAPEVEKLIVVGAAAGSLPTLPGVDAILRFEDLGDGAGSDLGSAPPSYRDTMSILYTSGTTGPAKGVVMTHLQYLTWVELYAESMGLTGDDTYFTPLPLFHGDAQLWGVYFPLVFGTRGVLEERFSASRYWDQVRRSGATATNLLGSMAHILWNRPRTDADALNPLRVCQVLPMVPFRAEFAERFGLELTTAYGQTETNWVAFDTPSDTRRGSCGRINERHFEVEVVDEHDEPRDVGDVGEIVVRPRLPWIMSQGYHAMPEATLDAWRNLWFHTGDLGHVDAEGWLYFDDRLKDSIRRRGQNISAYEVETVIESHPAVGEAAAIGVPSELSEDDLFVVITLRGGTELTPAELLDFCKEELPRFMVPRYVEIRSEPLPRTPTEKIAKTELRRAGVGSTTWDAEIGTYVDASVAARAEDGSGEVAR